MSRRRRQRSPSSSTSIRRSSSGRHSCYPGRTRPGDVALRRPASPSTVSRELLSGRRGSSSLAGIVRAAVSGVRAIHLSQVLLARADSRLRLSGLPRRVVGVVPGRSRVHRLLGVVAVA